MKRPTEHGDFFFLLTALLLIVIVLLLIPWVCGCLPSHGWRGIAPSATSTLPTMNAGLSPAAGPVGTQVTIRGSGFSSAANTVLMNGLTTAGMKNLASPDGATLQFTIPQAIGPNCKPNEMCAQFLVEISAGTIYKISVDTGKGMQDIGSFTVTGAVK